MGDLARAIGQLSAAKSITEAKSHFVSGAREVFGGRAWGLYFLDASCQPIDREVIGIPDHLLDSYEEEHYAVDLVVRAMLERQAPVHHLEIFPEHEWARMPAVILGRKLLGLEHYMTAPMFGEGRVVATMAVARGTRDRPYDQHDLLTAAALAGHMSVKLALLRTQERPHPLLTERESEIAALVARGLTNEAIGTVLGISVNTVKAALKKIFQKLDVSSRAALVARLG